MVKSSHKPKPNSDQLVPSYDPKLISLFASSLGPVQISLRKAAAPATKLITPSDESLVQSNASLESTKDDEIASLQHSNGSDINNASVVVSRDESLQLRSRKRKRRQTEDNLEGNYLHNLGREGAKEHAKRRKEQLDLPVEFITIVQEPTTADNGSTSDIVELSTRKEEANDTSSNPQHESLGPSAADSEVEKASRTIFLANVSIAAIRSKSSRKVLLEHLTSLLPPVSEQAEPHKLESLRFRSTAFNNSAAPKKAAFAQKDLMDSTTRSTHAYAVYTTPSAARDAAKKLNGTIVLDRHLRVDSVAHPAKQDHRRCVFVGNLGFVDDEAAINAAEDGTKKRPRKPKEAADVEEGLWRQFSKAGTVESVRVIRDKTTRVGKGFAYVQFENPNGVERALQFNEKKFPPLLPRKLRVTRAKNASKTEAHHNTAKKHMEGQPNLNETSGYRPKMSSQVQSLSGRAGQLLGRAGAAHVRNSVEKHGGLNSVTRSPAAIVFEGYRATSKDGKGTLKLKGNAKSKGRPQNRSSRRGAAFKAGKKKK